MRRLSGLFAVVVGLGLALALGIAVGRWVEPHPRSSTPAAITAAHSPGRAARGALLFQMHCAKCHGDEGHGDGESAATMRPPPRDFSARPWRFAPTRGAIRQVLDQGIPGTAMPAVSQAFSPADLEALIDHTLQLAEASPSGQVERAPETEEERLFRLAGFAPISPRPAPKLRLETAGGQEVSLDDFRGQAVLLNFWGTSCEHCLAKLSQLRELEIELAPAGLQVLSVCADADDAQQAQEVADKVSSGHTVYCDLTGLANQRYEVQVLPTVWLIDREGQVVGQTTGGQDWSRVELRHLLAHLLAE